MVYIVNFIKLKLKFLKLKADDAIRTRDIGLGRTTLYQLSYIRRDKLFYRFYHKKTIFQNVFYLF
jgi:hypothetical protein